MSALQIYSDDLTYVNHFYQDGYGHVNSFSRACVTDNEIILAVQQIQNIFLVKLSISREGNYKGSLNDHRFSSVFNSKILVSLSFKNLFLRDELFDFLKTNRTLTTLQIEKCLITQDGKNFVDCLKTNKKIRIFMLRFNYFSIKCSEDTVTAISEKENTELIDFRDNATSLKMLTEFSNIIKANKNLRHIKFSMDRDVLDSSWKDSFIKALEKNFLLETVEINSVVNTFETPIFFNPQELEKLCQAINKNVSLTSFRISRDLIARDAFRRYNNVRMNMIERNLLYRGAITSRSHDRSTKVYSDEELEGLLKKILNSIPQNEKTLIKKIVILHCHKKNPRSPYEIF